MLFQNNNIIDINCIALHEGHCRKWMGLMLGTLELLWYCILYLIYGVFVLCILYLIYGVFVLCICMMFLIVLGPSAKLNGFNQDKSVWTASIVLLLLLKEVAWSPQTLLTFSTFSVLCIIVGKICVTVAFCFMTALSIIINYKTDYKV